jgi:hypothetical protein
MQLKLIKTARGNDAVVYEGYTFRKNLVLRSGLTTWRCVNKNCKSNIKTNDKYFLTRNSPHAHNHPQTSKTVPLCSSPTASLSPSSEFSKKGDIGETSFSSSREFVMCTTTPSFIAGRGDETSFRTSSPIISDDISVHENSSKSLENLTAENERLKNAISTLKQQWNAAIDRSIDLDRRLDELSSVTRVDVSVQTDSAIIEQHNEHFPLTPNVLVNRGCQTNLPDSHQCFHLTTEINTLRMKCVEYRARLNERDEDVSQLQEKFKEA